MESNPCMKIQLPGIAHPVVGITISGAGVRPEKFQFLEKGQNHNFGYKIVISIKNP